MASHDAFQSLVQADKDIESSTISFGLRTGNPLYDRPFQYGLPKGDELRKMNTEQFEEALRECAEPTFGVVREDPEDQESRIIHWMPTDIRWLHMTLIQNEIDKRSERKYRLSTLSLAIVAILISVAALVVTTFVAPGGFSIG